jgi:hypothetical protein
VARVVIEKDRSLKALRPKPREDAKNIRTTTGAPLFAINAAILRGAHAALETGTAIGQIVPEGWVEALESSHPVLCKPNQPGLALAQ